MVRVGLFAGLVIAGSGEFGGVSGPGTSGLVHPLHCRGGVDVDQVCEHSELDEVFIKINGTSHYLWRAVDQHGNVLDILVTSRRDAKAATIYKSTSTPRNQALNSANSPNTWLSSPGTSAPTPTGSPTTASAAAAVRPSPPPSSSPPSTKWSPKRMVKKQQMRWSPQGAHLFLQVRTQVLNDDLGADFARWYPGFSHQREPVLDGRAGCWPSPLRTACTGTIGLCLLRSSRGC